MNETLPFAKEGQYNGRVQINLFHSWYPSSIPSEPESLPILFPHVVTERLSILPFVEPYRNEFKDKFNKRFSESFPDQEELVPIRKILEKELGLSESIAEDLIRKDSLKILENNLFTGYRIVDKEANKTIGRVSMEEYSKGRVKCGIVLDKNYQNQKLKRGAGSQEKLSANPDSLKEFGHCSPNYLYEYVPNLSWSRPGGMRRWKILCDTLDSNYTFNLGGRTFIFRPIGT